MKHVLDGLFVAVNDIGLEGRAEVRGVAQDFQEATDAVSCLILGLFLNVNFGVLFVERTEDLVQKFKKFEWWLVVEFY